MRVDGIHDAYHHPDADQQRAGRSWLVIEAIEWELFCALWRERRAAPFAEEDAYHPCRRMLVTPAEFTVVSEGREK